MSLPDDHSSGTPPPPPPPPPPPSPPRATSRLRALIGVLGPRTGSMLFGTVVGVLLFALVLLVSSYYRDYGLTISRLIISASETEKTTESAFLDSAVRYSNASSEVRAEWRSARSDHKIIAYAIANCSTF